MAAPALSLTLKTWCFPVVGCVGYRGYFDEAEAEAEAAGLRREGWRSRVYPVPAYSTLGWMNWAGGDPLLNTFIDYPEGELARLIFHELAHQVVYAPGRHHVQRVVRHRGRAPGRRALAAASRRAPQARPSTPASTRAAPSSARSPRRYRDELDGAVPRATRPTTARARAQGRS